MGKPGWGQNLSLKEPKPPQNTQLQEEAAERPLWRGRRCLFQPRVASGAENEYFEQKGENNKNEMISGNEHVFYGIRSHKSSPPIKISRFPSAYFQPGNVHPAPLPSFPAAQETASGSGRNASTLWRTRPTGTRARASASPKEPSWPPLTARRTWLNEGFAR